MRARPPPGLALTGQEIASSNTTLNALLGGRQKSWMTGTGSAVRPTPRVQGTQRQELNVLPSPAPSDESSPQQVALYGSSSNDANHVVNQATPQSLPQFEQSQPSPSLGQQETSLHTQAPNVAQPYSSVQGGLPNVRQIPPYKKQKTTQTSSAAPSLMTRKALIEQHIASSGGLDALDPAVERPRFRLLHDACSREDLFFVALHQLFCLWAIDPKAVSQIDGFQDQQLLEYAFQLVAKLIRGNERIPQPRLKWFSEFPSPLNHLLARSDQYRSALSAVRFFLGKLRSEKSSMIQECQKRGYPPLVDEMVYRLGLLSPVLQGVFFTAGRRTLGIRDDEVGPQMEQLFLQDREGHERLAARYNTNSPPTETEVRERNAWLTEQYLSLRNNNQQRPDLRLSTHQQPTAVEQTQQSRPGSLSGSPQNSNTPRLSSNHLTYVHSSSSVGVPQNPPPQHTEAPNAAPQYTGFTPPAGQVGYQNVISGTVSQVTPSPYPLQHEFPEQSYTSQNPQHMGNDQHSRTNSILRSNHEPISPSLASSNGYPRVVTSTGMQPNVYQQQVPVTMQPNAYQQQVPVTMQHNVYQQQVPVTMQHNVHQQQVPVTMSQHPMAAPMPYPPPQFQPQQIIYRRSSASGTEQNVQGFQRMNSIPPGMAPSVPARGGHIISPSPVQSMAVDSARRPNHVVRQNSGPVNWQTLIIPRPGESLPPHAPVPDLTALHQSNLRSPYLVPIDKPVNISFEDPAGRYYQAVADFAVGPELIPNDTPLRIENFVVPINTYARVPKDALSLEFPPIRNVRRGSLQYRLRCVQARPGQLQKPSDFVIAETMWPATVFMELNGKPIEFRRKLHHGKDLPVDITPLIQSIANNSINQVKISIPRSNGYKDNSECWFAVEIIEIFQHKQIIDMTLSKHIPAEETIKNIKNSLSGSFIDEDDDEISMAVSDLTINLVDPFLAKIFDIPVRGTSCLHRECFDLQTFLTTRNSKPKMPRQPSMVDVWRCPLCGKDARPHSLRVDDFLVSVRETLAQSNALSTKAIIVSADGSWRPKQEPLPSKRSASNAGLDEDDLYDSDDVWIKKSETPVQKNFPDIEVIDLDDD